MKNQDLLTVPQEILSNIYSYNCGGFALRTFTWYTPYNIGVGDIIEDLYNLDYFEKEIEDLLLDLFVERMLDDFPSLHLIHEKDIYNEKFIDKEIIAFRIGVIYQEKYEELDFDFHFRKRLYGQWYEKQGEGKIRKCNFETNNWHDGDFCYDSKIVYFVLENKNV